MSEILNGARQQLKKEVGTYTRNEPKSSLIRMVHPTSFLSSAKSLFKELPQLKVIRVPKIIRRRRKPRPLFGRRGALSFLIGLVGIEDRFIE